MRLFKFCFFLLFLFSIITSCNNKLEVNAPWKDITVVYALLNQNQDTNYIKITKAFLGEGNALDFAKIADSSNYPEKLDVKIDFGSNSVMCDTITIHNKQVGDDIFYYPSQLVYYFTKKLDTNMVKLTITDPTTGKQVTSQTKLIGKIKIATPRFGTQADIRPGMQVPLEFTSALYGRRYQLTIRFYYDEYFGIGHSDTLHKSLDWIAFDDVTSSTLEGTETVKPFVSGTGLYSTMRNELSKISPSSDTTRLATAVDYYIFAGSDDLNTYMNVTAPSNSIVQERPSFTNIVNGIGLFSSTNDNRIDSPRHLSIKSGSPMADSIKAYSSRYFLGF